jgi:hypothetical protein
MSTAERIAWGLLSFILLIVWLRWRGTEDQKKVGPPPSAESKRTEPQVHKSQSSLGPTLRGSAGDA